MKTGFDSVASTTAEWRQIVPANPEVIGAYINGLYANANAARLAFPEAILYTYDVNGSRPDADVLDIERFDATVAQAPGWFHAWGKFKHTLPKPTFYTSAGNVQALIDTMTAAGIARSQYLILSAHYQAGEHICGPSTCKFPQADGTQWDDKGAQGQNTDRLDYNDNFFPAPAPAPKPTPKPKPKPAPDPLLDYTVLTPLERKIVLSYDGARKHPAKYAAYLLVLRAQLATLAGAVYVAAHKNRPPSWGMRNRGTRFQILIRRAHGEQIAK